MTHKLKQSSGWLLQEYIAMSGHLFENGEQAIYSNGNPITDHLANEGEYTGRFCFQYKDGQFTKMYTVKSAPKWLQVLYDKVIRG